MLRIDRLLRSSPCILVRVRDSQPACVLYYHHRGPHDNHNHNHNHNHNYQRVLLDLDAVDTVERDMRPCFPLPLARLQCAWQQLLWPHSDAHRRIREYLSAPLRNDNCIHHHHHDSANHDDDGCYHDNHGGAVLLELGAVVRVVCHVRPCAACAVDGMQPAW